MRRFILILVLAGVTCPVGSAVFLSGQASSQAAPAAVAIPWPFGSETGAAIGGPTGEARFRVTVEKGTVTTIETLKVEADSFYGLPPTADRPKVFEEAAQAYIRQWRFESNGVTTFETTVRHRLSGRTGCEQDTNQIVRATVPTLIEVVSKQFLTLCDPIAMTTTEFGEPVAVITGTLRCECTGEARIRGATIDVFPGAEENDKPMRRVRTNDRGEFVISNLEPGRYRLSLNERGYLRSDYVFVVAPSGHHAPVEFTIKPNGMPPPARVITGGTIPTYPRAARQAGVEGVVEIRVSMRGATVLDIDAWSKSPELIAPAVANVRTWRFLSSGRPVETVQFNYRLTTGDCRANPESTVKMELPKEVTIEAVRGPCGSW